MSDTHYKFIANHLIFPLLFLFVAWSAAGFPVADGEKWGRIAQMFLAIYVPLKLTKILIHKRSGVLRHCDRARIAAASLLFVLWLVCAVVGFLQHGLLVLGGLVVLGYLIYLVWTDISGDEESRTMP